MQDATQRIQAALGRLPEEQQAQLADFAEFLVERHGGELAASEPEEPVFQDPGPEETPVQAIKRLRATYPMLEARHLLDETSQIMSKRYLQNRPVDEVIAELEATFARHYSLYLARF